MPADRAQDAPLRWRRGGGSRYWAGVEFEEGLHLRFEAASSGFQDEAFVFSLTLMWQGERSNKARLQGADAGGYSGLEDEVDNHWAEPFKAALLSAILGVGAELGSGADTGSNTAINQALRLSAANSLNQTGQQVVRRNLNIQPTLTIRPGISGSSNSQPRSRTQALQRMIRL